MGYNTVLVVYNDTVGMGAKDPNIGLDIYKAVLAWHSRSVDPCALSIHYRLEGGGGGSYGRVVSQDHADYSQLVVVGRNSGYRITDAQEIDQGVIDQMTGYLNRFGYRVQKMRKAALTSA